MFSQNAIETAILTCIFFKLAGLPSAFDFKYLWCEPCIPDRDQKTG